jgi:hypothetical protein
MESKRCPVCDEEFSRPANISKWSWERRQTCSRSCKAKLQWRGQREARAKNCVICGKRFTKSATRGTWEEWERQRACSRSCAAKMRWADRKSPPKLCACGDPVGDRRSEFKKGHRPSGATLKDQAHYRVKTAIRNGTLKKPKECSECGAGGRIHGHHADYSKPLDVEWLCSLCHRRRHPA